VSQILDIDAVAEPPEPRAMLLTELEDFVTSPPSLRPAQQRRPEPEPEDYVVTAGCSCGVVFMRWVTPQ
jgi:hypothetical protein